VRRNEFSGPTPVHVASMSIGKFAETGYPSQTCVASVSSVCSDAPDRSEAMVNSDVPTTKHP
jgi:hypothetical protein